jgi:hypothetical protein
MEITAELVETSTEARCGFMTFEAAHRSVLSLDPAMVLLDPTIQILVRPVFHAFVQFGSDRAWVTVMTIRRDTRAVTPVTALADRKNAFAASISRFSLSLTSTRAPKRSIAR